MVKQGATRTLRIPGLAVLAALALMAVAPGVVSAQVQVFQAGEFPATVSGEQEGAEGHVFTVDGGAVSLKCTKSTLSGELPEPLPELLVTPAYSECTAAGIAATVAVEGCQYRADANASDVDVVCPSGKTIKITAGTCEVQIGSQEGAKEAKYTNNAGSPSTVSVNATLTGLKYNKTKDGFLCPLAGLGEKADGTYSGKWLMKAVSEATQVNVFTGTLCENEPAWPEEDCAAWESSETEKELEEGWEPGEEQWPEEEGNPEEEEQAGHDPILFVHGFNGAESTFKTFIGWFKADGWAEARLHNWEYKWWRSNEGIAGDVEKKVNKLLEVTKAKKVDIITHSMGGLSARYYVKNGGAEKVDAFVSLGGPNHGTKTADACFLLYVSCVEMRRGSTFLAELNAGDETPGAVKYKTWRTPWDAAIIPSKSTELSGATNKVFKLVDGISHSELHEEKSIYEEVKKWVVEGK